MKVLIILFSLYLLSPIFAQDKPKEKKQLQNRWQQRYSVGKGAFYLRYGWNRSIYTKSDLSFKGPGYSFKIEDAVGKDSPEKFSFKTYFSPKTWSIPQFSVQLGYFFTDNWAVSVGWDHMKYVFHDGDYLVSGSIDSSANPEFYGEFDQSPVTFERENFHYENTDGLNYARIQIVRADQWWREKKGIVAFNTLVSLSTGMMITRNDFNFNGLYQKNDFAVSGWGISGHIGFRIDFVNLFFLQTNFGGGMVHLPKVNTRTGEDHYAKQIFMYGEMDLSFGAMWYIRKINRVPEKHIR